MRLKLERYRPKDYTLEKSNGLGVVWYCEQPKCYAIAYGGKRNKSDWHHSFPSPERMHAHIDNWLAGLVKTAEWKAEQKANREESSQAKAARNIKAELQAAFPGIKFSVRSDSFSMGDSVDVHWSMGPTTREVDAIISKYELGHFDGMQDLYEYDNSPETRAFQEKNGATKYANTHRGDGEFHEIMKKSLAEFCGVNPGDYAEEHNKFGCDLATAAYRIFAKQSFPAGAVITGVERTEKGAGLLDEFYRFTFTSPKTEPKIEQAAACASVQGAEMVKTKHTQKGYDLFVVRLGNRVSRDTFSALLSEAKSLGGWWSGYAKDGAVPGFQFKTEQKALAFLHVLNEKPTLEQAQAQDRAVQVQEVKADILKEKAQRLRDLADNMESQIDAKINSGTSQQNPTPRRIRIANSMRQEGEALQHTQSVLRSLANAIETGSVPPEFASVKWSKAFVHEHLHYSSKKDLPVGKWLRQLSEAPQKDEKAEQIRKIEQDLLFADIPGFFPTPPEVVQRMIDFVKPSAGEVILEPSAGSGAIACAVNHGSKVEALEVNYSLRNLLQLKGVDLVGSDFMEFQPGKQYDGVLMNPPFEHGQDVEHIRKAFEHLKSGGRIAAICAPGFAFRSEEKYSRFREWLGEIAADIEELPAGTFKKSGTGVAARLILATKD